MRVLSILKESGGLRKRDLARRLNASQAAVESALVQLVKQSAVTVQAAAAAAAADDLIVP